MSCTLKLLKKNPNGIDYMNDGEHDAIFFRFLVCLFFGCLCAFHVKTTGPILMRFSMIDSKFSDLNYRVLYIPGIPRDFFWEGFKVASLKKNSDAVFSPIDS